MNTPRRTARSPLSTTGFVSLVGAGPGDPELLTYRAIQRLRHADLVYYDGLVPKQIVQLASSADHVSVARRSGKKAITQEQVSDLLIAAARRGQQVVRLKAGDPFVLGRGGEEALALSKAGVPFEVVPGVTSAIAAATLAGIPVTHRDVSSGFLVISGHAPDSYAHVLGSLAPDSVTVVVLMGLAERARIASFLIRAGWRKVTPTAVVTNASQPDQRIWTGRLEELGSKTPVFNRRDPGVIIIGDVVSVATAPSIALSLSVQETPWQPTTTQRL